MNHSASARARLRATMSITDQVDLSANLNGEIGESINYDRSERMVRKYLRLCLKYFVSKASVLPIVSLA